MTRPCDEGLGARRGSLRGGQHLERLHHGDHAASTGADRLLVEAERLAGFVEKHRDFALEDRLAKRAVTHVRVDQDRDAEGVGESVRLRVVETRANLREVGAVDRRGVEIDAMRRSGVDADG